ncbi:MAG: protein translocase subunit SecF, partial [Pseudomonadota bacterium]
ALVVALGLMLIYIWFRFEWQFSLGAVLALVHDVILTIGMFAVTQFEFNLSTIAALLTIIGYSMNDTVVVYDRVREELRRYKKLPIEKVVDLALNRTLSRTLLTSGTTLLALLSIFFLGGDVLRGFSFAMIWGVVIGTYSSVFVASALLMYTGVRRDMDQPAEDGGAAPAEA